MIFSFGSNEVVFDVTIYNALQSEAFYDIDMAGVVFSELSYDQGTGVHRVQANYAALNNNPTYVERWFMHQGMDVVCHTGKVSVFDATRGVVRGLFEENIRKLARKMVERRRYYFGNAVVNNIITNGGTLETDQATVLSHLKDKTVD